MCISNQMPLWTWKSSIQLHNLNGYPTGFSDWTACSSPLLTKHNHVSHAAFSIPLHRSLKLCLSDCLDQKSNYPDSSLVLTSHTPSFSGSCHIQLQDDIQGYFPLTRSSLSQGTNTLLSADHAPTFTLECVLSHPAGGGAIWKLIPGLKAGFAPPSQSQGPLTVHLVLQGLANFHLLASPLPVRSLSHLCVPGLCSSPVSSEILSYLHFCLPKWQGCSSSSVPPFIVFFFLHRPDHYIKG